ncbi:OsmC family protein [Microbacterium gorillae]|uniref:OsmC family protein n=1 Tax=Microbacterium gorillae TaxID=1231063 RepID=UPI0005900E61|nr:OsmC family protein [Microbacterium gorillae]
MTQHTYAVTAEWTGNTGTGSSGYRAYERSVSARVEGKPELALSADRPFRGDPTRWNPEDLLLSSLSTCHMLSYLHACVTGGIVVLSYVDAAEGAMVTEGNGGRFAEVVLRPRVVVASADMIDAAVAAHEPAHEWCFIANSVNFPVRVQPQVTAAE